MNSFGRKFRVSIFGESHGPVVGVVLDGVPAGIALSVEDFAQDLSRRHPSGKFTTARKEEDLPQIVSGVFNGHTTGSPLTIIFSNSDVHSSDYAFLPDTPRPGHADYPAHIRFDGYEDYRGGGHFSGRLTLAVVAAGVVAKKLLPEGVVLESSIVALGGSSDETAWPSLLSEAAACGDSLGAVLQCKAEGLPVGLGEPFWDSVESLMSHAVFAIPGVRGIEFGDGFAAAAMLGSQHNDPIGETGPVTNGAGGVNGGLTNGAPLEFRVAFKPTSSISLQQQSFDFKTHKPAELNVRGRHDVCFALRCPVIVEAIAAIVLADLL